MRRAWPRADIRSCRDELLRSSVCATTNPGTSGRALIIAGCPQVRPRVRSTPVKRRDESWTDLRHRVLRELADAGNLGAIVAR